MWGSAYLIRFQTDLLPEPPGAPDAADYVAVLLVAIPLFYALLRYRGLYGPRRGLSRVGEARAILEVTTIGTIVLAASTFFWRSNELSRSVVMLFWALSSVGLMSFRLALRLGLSALRRRGFNLRRVLIVGTGELARQVFKRFHDHPETGFSVVGFVGPQGSVDGGRALNVIGSQSDLHQIVTDRLIDHVIIALDRSDPMDPIKVVDELHDTTATVRIAPDMLGLRTMRPSAEDFDGLPMICLIESPILGWDEVAKRTFDVTAAIGGLVVLSPLYAMIALAIRFTSPGAPVVYRQERMSLDGRLFTMLKFRTMIPDAERATGPTWAKQDDPRRTKLGMLLRRTNLDELPQLWNILRGEMSVVGPRPERPAFTNQFRREIRGYMRRHKVKGGLTGWAQVNGYRGNTSIRRRLEYDIEYAQRWSLAFDLKIILLTVVRSFRDPNAY